MPPEIILSERGKPSPDKKKKAFLAFNPCDRHMYSISLMNKKQLSKNDQTKQLIAYCRTNKIKITEIDETGFVVINHEFAKDGTFCKRNTKQSIVLGLDTFRSLINPKIIEHLDQEEESPLRDLLQGRDSTKEEFLLTMKLDGSIAELRVEAGLYPITERSVGRPDGDRLYILLYYTIKKESIETSRSSKKEKYEKVLDNLPVYSKIQLPFKGFIEYLKGLQGNVLKAFPEFIFSKTEPSSDVDSDSTSIPSVGKKKKKRTLSSDSDETVSPTRVAKKKKKRVLSSNSDSGPDDIFRYDNE